MPRSLIVAVTGASGAVYGRGVVEAALAAGVPVELVASVPARRVARAAHVRRGHRGGKITVMVG